MKPPRCDQCGRWLLGFEIVRGRLLCLRCVALGEEREAAAVASQLWLASVEAEGGGPSDG
jgi:hypothetical protein